MTEYTMEMIYDVLEKVGGAATTMRFHSSPQARDATLALEAIARLVLEARARADSAEARLKSLQDAVSDAADHMREVTAAMHDVIHEATMAIKALEEACVRSAAASG